MSIDLSSLETSPFSEVEKRFKSAQKSIYRLELLQEYSVGYEDENYKSYLEKGTFKKDFLHHWFDTTKSTLNVNVSFQRVRFLKHPITKYTQFEIGCYRLTREAGEEIRIFEVNDLSVFSGKVPLLTDYCLFDDEYGYFMIYGLLGECIGSVKILENSLQKYIKLKKENIKISMDILNTELLY